MTPDSPDHRLQMDATCAFFLVCALIVSCAFLAVSAAVSLVLHFLR